MSGGDEADDEEGANIMSHGGPRPGAGRPRTWATKPVARTLRMSEEAWATLDALTIVLGSSTSQAAAAAICMAAEGVGLRRKVASDNEA